MKPSLCGLVSLAMMCLAATAARGQDNKLPEKVAAILDGAEQLELTAIEPEPAKDPPRESIHGHKIIGKTAIIKGDGRKELLTAFRKGMEGNIDPARCFNPRHVIKAAHKGQTVELVICFECSQFEVYIDSKKMEGPRPLIGKAPEELFDKLLTPAGK